MSTSKSRTLLLIDDEKNILKALERCLKSLGLNIVSCLTAEQAISFCREQKPDLIICDQRMPDVNGLELLHQLHSIQTGLSCLMLSAHQDFDAVTEAFNEGLIERFVGKPWEDEELRFIVKSAMAQITTDAKLNQWPEKAEAASEPKDFHGIVSNDDSMAAVFSVVRKAATANVPIFISGETGTGKELVAQACHFESYRWEQPFIAFNCANFNENLMESQLFGHKKGAFTGADKDHQGLFEVAAEGSLFLDEITTLPLALQAQMLRVIQEREFSPVGSHEIRPFKAHLMTASSTPLSEAVASGEFRRDLFFRLNVIPVSLPPLRERGDDAHVLASYFLQSFCKMYNKNMRGFEPQASEFVRQYSWPGNVRQLENVIHHVVIMNRAEWISFDMLNLPAQQQTEAFLQSGAALSKDQLTAPETDNPAEIIPLSELEREAINRAIEHCDGNVPKAAAILGVSPSTIYRKMKSWENS